MDLGSSVLQAARAVCAQDWLVVLSVYGGLEVGPAQVPEIAVAGVPDVASQRFDAGGKRGRAAVEARFRDQIGIAAGGSFCGQALAVTPISPSGIQNPVVTEILRTSRWDLSRRRAWPLTSRVEYRDGSRSANPFPAALPAASAEKVNGVF